ncbi:MAG: LacI family DNA-binding transcriptional regulator [Verrucomicrobiota bacterium]|nr:LacI family DNA-binding transcriptional regulator [Verrucomicrobiota bacterium]
MEKRITTVELANALQLSQATVSRALSGHPAVRPQTRERVLQKAAEMNYVPDTGSRTLVHRRWNRSTHSTNLNLVLLYTSRRELEGSTRPWFSPIMSQLAMERGFTIDFIDVLDYPKAASLIKKIKVVSAAGLIIALDQPHPAVTELCESFPAVAYGYRTFMPSAPGIVPDFFQCSCLLVDTVIAHGYRRILFPRADTGQENTELSNVIQSVFDYSSRSCEARGVQLNTFLYAREQPGPFFERLESFRPDVVLAMFWTPGLWLNTANPVIAKAIGYAELNPHREGMAGVVLEKSVEQATIELLERYIYSSHHGIDDHWLRYHIRGRWREGASLPMVPAASR